MDTGGKKPASEAQGSSKKLHKPNSYREDVKDINWSLACKEVSGNEFFDYHKRFQIVHLPTCLTDCNHGKNSVTLKPMPSSAEESFRTELRNHVWYDALEVCYMSITTEQYLSADVLQEVIEIMMNVHEDQVCEYTAKYIIDNCLQVLFQNFSIHPPCLDKSLRDCYVKFLTSSMPEKMNTYTDRNKYEYEKGIFKYCMNRLECELSPESKDRPIVDSFIPEHLANTLQGFHWQKQNFEIFEALNREERIKRLFSVLETIIEVLQFDLAIQQSRYLEDPSRQMRCSKLMEHVLWTPRESSTGSASMSDSCRQIIRIFSNIVHLKYPQAMTKTITMWLNTMIQTIYARGSESNTDYPNMSSNLKVFANEFYNIIAEFPHDSIIRILEKIEPTYMRYLVGLCYLNQILSVNEGCIFKILEDFLSQSQWQLYPTKNDEIKLSKKLFKPPKLIDDKVGYLLKKFGRPATPDNDNSDTSTMFPKKNPELMVKTDVNLHHIVHTLYITLEAYLDATKLESVQETWIGLNEQMLKRDLLCTYNCYSVSDEMEWRYKYNLNAIKKISSIFNDLQNQGQLPPMFKIFGKIKLLQLQIKSEI